MAFIDATRQNIRPLDERAVYSAGGRSAMRLPRVGLLARIYIHVSGTMTLTTGGGTHTLSSKGPWNLIDTVSVTANQGMEVIRLSGWSAHLLDVTSDGKPYLPDNGLISASFAGDNYAAGVSAGANAWDFNLCINVTPNERDLVGLLLLQTDQMSAELVIRWATAAGASIESPVVLTGGASGTFVGGADVTIETFTVPADPADRPDLTVVYQQLERVDPITNVGDNTLQLLRANIYSRILQTFELNGTKSHTNITRTLLRYNNADTPYELTRDQALHLQRRRYGRDLPDGVLLWDLFYQGNPGYGTNRDLINAGAVAEFASIFTVASGATLGAGNNFVRTATQQFVQLGGPQR